MFRFLVTLILLTLLATGCAVYVPDGYPHPYYGGYYYTYPYPYHPYYGRSHEHWEHER